MARFGCPECLERFDSVGDKKRHMKREHNPYFSPVEGRVVDWLAKQKEKKDA